MKLIGENNKSTLILLSLLILVAFFAEWTDDFYGHCLTESMHEPPTEVTRSGHGGADPNFMARMQVLANSGSSANNATTQKFGFGNNASKKGIGIEESEQTDNDTVLAKFGAYDRKTGIKIGNEYQSAFGASENSLSNGTMGLGSSLDVNNSSFDLNGSSLDLSGSSSSPQFGMTAGRRSRY